MALESETGETLEAAALQSTPAERERVVDRLIATLDADRSLTKLGHRKWSAGKPTSKMELLLYFPVLKASPN
jgi:hypothetical protein